MLFALSKFSCAIAFYHPVNSVLNSLAHLLDILVFHAAHHLLLVYQYYMHRTLNCLIFFLQLAPCSLDIKAPPWEKQYDMKDNVNEGNKISVIIFTWPRKPKKTPRKALSWAPPELFLMLVAVAVLTYQKFLVFTNCFLTFLGFSLHCKHNDCRVIFLSPGLFTLYSFTAFCSICDSDQSSNTPSRILLALIDWLLLNDTRSWAIGILVTRTLIIQQTS